MNDSLRGQAAFTITELMIALAVAAILATLAVPNFFETVRNARLTTQADDMLTSLNLARSEAQKRGARVSLCKSADGNACTASGGWEQGWIAFVDVNAPLGSRDTANPAQEPVLRANAALPPNYTLRGDTAIANAIGFRADGMATGSGLLVICHKNQLTASRAILLSNDGPARQLQDTDNNKIPNNGADITSCAP